MSQSPGDNSERAGVDSPFDMVAVEAAHEQRREIDAFFTALCPFAEETDRYDVRVAYRGRDEAIEINSFQEWVESFEGHEVSGEALASMLYEAVRERVGRAVEVELVQYGGNGVSQTITVGSCP